MVLRGLAKVSLPRPATELAFRFAAPDSCGGSGPQDNHHHWDGNEGNRLGDHQGALGGPDGGSDDEPEEAEIDDFS